MQIVVPAAGRGSRFLEAGYKEPKPLIEALGKPIIKWSTDGLKGVAGAHYTFLVLQEHITSYGIDGRLKELYPGCQVVPVNGVTEGAVCTVLLAKEFMNREEELFIVNCDNLFFLDMTRARNYLRPDTAGMIMYIAANHPYWSYVETDKNGNAVRIAEKEMISDKATVGCYYFTKAKYFIDAAEYMIQNNMRTKGEFYVSPVYNILIEQGKRIQTFPCDLHYSLGTPEELKNFIELFTPEYSRNHAAVAV